MERIFKRIKFPKIESDGVVSERNIYFAPCSKPIHLTTEATSVIGYYINNF